MSTDCVWEEIRDVAGYKYPDAKYETGCGHEWEGKIGWYISYCPYCGKPLEVISD